MHKKVEQVLRAWPGFSSFQELTQNMSWHLPIFIYLNIYCILIYEGRSINSDNGSISQKILLESELFMMQNVDMGNAYYCVKYGVFITTRFDAMRICIQHCG